MICKKPIEDIKVFLFNYSFKESIASSDHENEYKNEKN